MICKAKIVYPALRDSALYMLRSGTLSSLVCRIIATIITYFETASHTCNEREKKKKEVR